MHGHAVGVGFSVFVICSFLILFVQFVFRLRKKEDDLARHHQV